MSCSRCRHPTGEGARFCEACGCPIDGQHDAHGLFAAHQLEVRGRLDEACEAYAAILDAGVEPSLRARVHKHLGNLHLRQGHLRRARTHLVEAAGFDPTNAALWHDRGVVEYHMADFDAAIASFGRALELAPDQGLANFWLGSALYHRGDLEGAERSFSRLLDLYPNFTIARFHLGVIYARKGDRERAEEQFRRVLVSNPEDAAARYYVSP